MPSSDEGPLRTDGGTGGGGDATSETEPAADGGLPTGPVPPDNETPTFYDRKARTTGLARLTYEYFERARYEDQTVRQSSDYVERDVLAFPTWPHETVRNLSIASFFVGMILFLSATMPPHIGPPANPSQTPAIILPDWYLYWSFGLLKLDPLNPELAILGGQKLMADRTYGVLANGVVVGFIAIVPFLNKGSARRPVEEPFWAAVGVAGVVFAMTISILAIQNLVPISVRLLFDLTFLLPLVFGTITYAVLKTMREGYMYNLNRRYYRLRPPKKV
ncbi:cytochrome bc complex cytochrome b subunit [Haloferax sp. MBLA0076]|uniref:Cytochrome bc complex cytochrome b subunit n=1 Tax=Haloferax litoreum TaxID=2666140 RepID=A0A6A8GEL8_9EURY|nr:MULTISPECIES: cytochrome bc complex cytochrome b subunit [Haloferax]KAB1192149.1 cytochrome bc complex cytochrome b subunit [Haloferax sp. CBA1148]MRX20597.1 cytochrome bc complex cytochrome b subunit [Haloferax litoreum]